MRLGGEPEPLKGGNRAQSERELLQQEQHGLHGSSNARCFVMVSAPHAKI